MDARQRQQLVFFAARYDIFADERLWFFEAFGREQCELGQKSLGRIVARAHRATSPRISSSARLGVLVIFLQILLVAVLRIKRDLLRRVVRDSRPRREVRAVTTKSLPSACCDRMLARKLCVTQVSTTCGSGSSSRSHAVADCDSRRSRRAALRTPRSASLDSDRLVDPIRRRVADARDHLQYSFPRQLVARIDDDAQIRNHVLDMRLLEKSHARLDAVRNVRGATVPAAVRSNDNASDTSRRCLRAACLRRAAPEFATR